MGVLFLSVPLLLVWVGRSYEEVANFSNKKHEQISGLALQLLKSCRPKAFAQTGCQESPSMARLDVVTRATVVAASFSGPLLPVAHSHY